MACVRDCRTDKIHDLDYEVDEMFCKGEYPFLDLENDDDYVHISSLSTREYEELEKLENGEDK